VVVAAHRDQRRDRGTVTVAVIAALAVVIVVVLIPVHAQQAAAARPAARAHISASVNAARRAAPAKQPVGASPAMSGTGPPYDVTTTSIRLVDPSRSTGARGDVPAAPGRLLVTDLYLPVGATGPRPLVMFAHGWNSDPSVYAALLDQWATAGFIVAAPIFPDSTDLYPGTPISDYADQAQDMSFVITSLLHDTALAIDPTRIAVAGHSDGGTDVALLALDPDYADARVRAYLSLSGEMPSGVAAYTIAPSRVPLLVAVGTKDEYGLYPLSSEVFQQSRATTKAMLVEQGGDHLGSFLDATSAAAAMRADTTRFLELALEPRPPTSAAVVAALGQPSDPGITVVPPTASEPAGGS
jgi:acetyl esterase/lipase